MAAANYDYTKPGSYPRSGRDLVGGVVFLGRTIDKTRAHIAGTAGEYNALRGLSTRVFDLFGVTAEQFEQIVKENADDESVLRALEQKGKKPTQEEIEAHNKTVLERGPADEAGMERFRANLAKMGFGDRTDVKTHIDAEDLEEGREVPRRA
jgi:hypothetical protein